KLRGDVVSTPSIVPTANVIITLRGGSSDRPEIELQAGAKADAFSVGTDGSWRVSGPGMSAVHGYLYFDGTTLYVASAPGAVVKLAGAAVSADWKPVPLPGEIIMGGVAIDARSGGAAAGPQPSSGRGRPVPLPRAPTPPMRPAPPSVRQPGPGSGPAIGMRGYDEVDD